jgi:hypothetical protein
VLLQIISNLTGVFTFGGVSIMARRKASSNFGTRVVINLLGATTMVCQTPLFSNTTLVVFGFQLVIMCHLAATLCEDNITRMSTKLIGDSRPIITSQDVNPKLTHYLLWKCHLYMPNNQTLTKF